MKGEEWTTKLPGSVSPDGYNISSEVAAGIFNHYYSEAGFDVNGLSAGSVTPQVAGNSTWETVGLTEYGNQYTGLNTGDLRISAKKHIMGNILVTKYDYINMFVHEYDHLNSFKENERKGLYPYYDRGRDIINFEINALKVQLNHDSWRGTSSKFREGILYNIKKYLGTSDYNKYLYLME